MSFVITEEFAAHGADVNCVGLGHKSGRVMVTGGEDRKVNLWSVGKAHCIMVSVHPVHSTNNGSVHSNTNTQC